MTRGDGTILVLDAYGVIYRPGDDVQGQLIPFIAEKGGSRDVEQIRAKYREASLGQITAAAFWASAGIEAALEDEYLSRIRLIEGVPDFLRAAQSAFAGIAFLSNDVSEWSRKLRERHGLAAAISTWIISGDVGLRKPTPEIYRVLLRRLGVPASQVVFVDDRVENLDAARALGIHTVLLAPFGSLDQGHVIARQLSDILQLTAR